MLVFGAAYLLFRMEKEIFEGEKYQAFVYPVVLLGMTLFAVQLPLSFVSSVDLLESANYSISISDFFQYGKLPIIDHFPGHMLSGVLGGLLYGVTNSDPVGAVAAPYSVYIYVVLVLVFYYFINSLTNKEFAFWCSLLLPVFGGFESFLNPDSNYGMWGFFGVGMLICLMMQRYITQKTFFRSTLIWLACVIVVLYRLDLGAAFGVAAVTAGICYTIFFHEGETIDRLLLPFLIVILLSVALFVGVCAHRGIPAMERLMEILHIASSNANWAYGNLGNMTGTMFAWCYCILPAASGVMLMTLVCSKRIREKCSACEYCSLIFLGVAYFANFSRGLVRHSMAENNVTVVTFCGVFFVLVYILCMTGKRQVFIYCLMGMIVFYGMYGEIDGSPEASLAEKAGEHMGEFIDGWEAERGELTAWETISGAAKRVRYEEELETTALLWDAVLSTALKEEETYLDFVNKTFLYSLLGRSCPVYVSQSPALVAGEEAQAEFLEEIENSTSYVAAALMPNETTEGFSIMMDGIPNTCRYYKIAEYIYQNFVPVCKFEDVSLWCRKDRKEQVRAALEAREQEFLELSGDFCMTKAGEDSSRKNHSQDIKYLPYFWGTFDEKKADQNAVVRETQYEHGIFSFSEIGEEEKYEGNYLLLKCTYTPGEEEEEKIPAKLQLGTGQEGFRPLYEYDFYLLEGEQKYLFRVSTDEAWYFSSVNAAALFEICPEEGQKVKELDPGDDRISVETVQILYGD